MYERNLNEIHEEEAVEGEQQQQQQGEDDTDTPLDLRYRAQPQQQQYGWSCQPPEEKAGAGILIRNLSKPNIDFDGHGHGHGRGYDQDPGDGVDNDNGHGHGNGNSTDTDTGGEIDDEYQDIGPQLGDTVKIHYEAFLFKDDGSNTLEETPFDSSRKRNLPFCFCIGKEEVIDGLDIAVEQMTLGQLVEVTIPYLYAYGEQGYAPQIPPKSTLVFRVELLDFTSGDVTGRKWQK